MRKTTLLSVVLLAGLASAQNVGFISNLLNDFTNLTVTEVWNVLITAVAKFISYNPNLNDWGIVKEMQKVFWIPVSGFFFCLVTWIGIKWIAYSDTETGRAKAKADLKRAFVGMILVAVSPFLFDIGLSISGELSKAMIISQTGKDYTDFFNMMSTTGIAFYYCQGPIMILLLLMVGMVLAFRIIALFFVAITFPLAIAFYFSDVQWLRGLGTKAVNLFFMVILAQIIMAFFFSMMLYTGNTMTKLMGSDPAGAIIAYFMSMGCLVLVALAPFMVSGLMKLAAPVIGIAGSAVAVAAPIVPEAGLVAGVAKGLAYGMDEMGKSMDISGAFHATWKGAEHVEKAGGSYVKERFGEKKETYVGGTQTHVGGSWSGGYTRKAVPNSGGRSVQSGIQEGAVRTADSEYHNASTDEGKIEFMVSSWNTGIGKRAQDEYNRDDPTLAGRKHSNREGDYKAEALRQYQMLKDNDVIREDAQGNIHVGHMGQEMANRYNIPSTTYSGAVPHGPEPWHDASREYAKNMRYAQDGKIVLKNSITQSFNHDGNNYNIAVSEDSRIKGHYNVGVEGNNQSVVTPIDPSTQDVKSREELMNKIQAVSSESTLAPERVAITMAEGYKPVGALPQFGGKYTWMADKGDSYDYLQIDPITQKEIYWNSIKGGGKTK